MRSLRWVDTRDMRGDGHAKGSIARLALWQLAAGQLYRLYASKSAAIKPEPKSLMGANFARAVAQYLCSPATSAAMPIIGPSSDDLRSPVGQLLNDEEDDIADVNQDQISKSQQYSADLHHNLELMCWYLGHICQCPGFTSYAGPGKCHLTIEEFTELPIDNILTAVYVLSCVSDASARENNQSNLFPGAKLHKGRKMKDFCKGLSQWGGVPPTAYPDEAGYPNGDPTQTSYRNSGERDKDASNLPRFGSKKRGSDILEETDWADAGNDEYRAVLNLIDKKYQKILSKHPKLMEMEERTL